MGLAVFRRRVAGETRIRALDSADPPAVIKFVVPDPLMIAEYEAAAQQAMETVRKTPAYLDRYGLKAEADLTDSKVAGLSRIVVAVESAVLLWKDWNIADPGEGEGGTPVKRPMTAANIAALLGDQNLRAAWMMHLDDASPMERAEGNVSAASPTTTSGEAATTAGAA